MLHLSKPTSLKIIPLKFIAEELEKILGRKFVSAGSWNAPKDVLSFEFDYSDLDGYSGYMRGESKFLLFLLIETQDNGELWCDVKKDIDHFKENFFIQPEKFLKTHCCISFTHATSFLALHGVLPLNEDFMVYYEW